eukprot:360988-Chlamydomonas_euryale.AAC.6
MQLSIAVSIFVQQRIQVCMEYTCTRSTMWLVAAPVEAHTSMQAAFLHQRPLPLGSQPLQAIERTCALAQHGHMACFERLAGALRH